MQSNIFNIKKFGVLKQLVILSLGLFGIVHADQYRPTKYKCPNDMYILKFDAIPSAPKPQACVGHNLLDSYSCKILACDQPGSKCSKVKLIDSQNVDNQTLYHGLITTPSVWYQQCPRLHSGCVDGFGQVPDTYVEVKSVTCFSADGKTTVISADNSQN